MLSKNTGIGRFLVYILRIYTWYIYSLMGPDYYSSMALRHNVLCLSEVCFVSRGFLLSGVFSVVNAEAHAAPCRMDGKHSNNVDDLSVP